MDLRWIFFFRHGRRYSAYYDAPYQPPLVTPQLGVLLECLTGGRARFLGVGKYFIFTEEFRWREETEKRQEHFSAEFV